MGDGLQDAGEDVHMRLTTALEFNNEACRHVLTVEESDRGRRRSLEQNEERGRA